MVSPTRVLLAFMLGLLVLILIPAIAGTLAMDLRLRIGRMFYSWTTTVYGACAVVWRTLGNPNLKPIDVDDEKKIAQVVLSSGTLSDDQTLPFKDPADRLHYLYKKPFALVPETMPAAVDAELCEVAYWTKQKEQNEGVIREGGDGRRQADPFVAMSERLRAISPIELMNIAGRGVEPENVKSAERHTRARFEKYGGMVGAKEAGVVFLSFAVGAGVVAGLYYVKDRLLSDAAAGGGGGGGTLPMPPGMLAIDPVALLGGLPL